MPTDRDILNALLKIENSLEDAASELGIELYDLVERINSPEITAMLAQVEQARRACDAILASRLNRNPILTLHAIANQPLDDPELSPAERIRRAETVRKANVDLIRLANTLTGRSGAGEKCKDQPQETFEQRRQRECQQAYDNLHQIMHEHSGGKTPGAVLGPADHCADVSREGASTRFESGEALDISATPATAHGSICTTQHRVSTTVLSENPRSPPL